MKPARQFLHILRNDIRCHALEIGLVLVLNLVLALVLTQTWAESLDRPSAGEVIIDNAAQLLLVFAWCVLIGRVVQGHAVAGKAPYWLTRPHARSVLLASKLAFVLLFVHLPLFLSQLLIVTGSGVPLSFAQMLVDQAVLAICVSLPAMALAALTTSFSRFVFGGVAVVAVATLLVSALTTRFPIYRIGNFPSDIGSLAFLAVVLAILASIAGAALVFQYRRRATLRIAVSSIVAVSLLGLGLLTLTPLVVMGARAAFARPTTVPTTIRFQPAAEPRIVNSQDPSNPRLVLVPIDAIDTGEWIMSTSRVDIRLAAGREVELSGSDFDSGSGVGIRRNSDGDWLLLVMPPSQYDSLKDEIVSLHFIADTVNYEIRETEPIPRDGSFVIVDGRAQCGVPAIFPLTCRTSSGWTEASFDLTRAHAQQWWLPVRLRFAINPVVTVRMANGGLSEPRPLEIPSSVRRPVSHTRQDVTLENVRLGDWGPE